MTSPVLSNPTIPAEEAIRLMKLRAGTETDTQLGQFLGKAQSTVASWRRRGRVPEAAIVRFEQRLRSLSAK